MQLLCLSSLNAWKFTLLFLDMLVCWNCLRKCPAGNSCIVWIYFFPTFLALIHISSRVLNFIPVSSNSIHSNHTMQPSPEDLCRFHRAPPIAQSHCDQQCWNRPHRLGWVQPPWYSGCLCSRRSSQGCCWHGRGLLIDVLWKISAADRHVRKWGLSMPQNLSFGSKVLLILLLYMHVLFML